MAERPLHLCFVVQEWFPAQLNGLARLVHTRASGLAARGHVVRIITRGSVGRAVTHEDGLWVHRIPTTGHERPAEEIVPQPLWDHSASVLDELRLIDREAPIDLVDVPNWDVEGLATIQSGELTTVLGLHSSVATYIETDARFSADDPVYQEVLDAERRCYEQADAFLACSLSIVEHLERLSEVHVPRSRLGIVPHGLPRADPPPAAVTLDRTPGRPLEVLFVGRLEARKGIATMLAAIPKVIADHRDVHVTIVGDDTITSPAGPPFRDLFESSYDGHAFGSFVSFTGIVDEAELDRQYRACDVFVAPSLYESFGLILLEAMRLAKPVVTTAVGGTLEVVGDARYGCLVPPGDAPALATAIVELLRDPLRRARLGAAGRRRFEECFTDERMIDGIEQFYGDVVSSRQTSSA